MSWFCHEWCMLCWSACQGVRRKYIGGGESDFQVLIESGNTLSGRWSDSSKILVSLQETFDEGGQESYWVLMPHECLILRFKKHHDWESMNQMGSSRSNIFLSSKQEWIRTGLQRYGFGPVIANSYINLNKANITKSDDLNLCLTTFGGLNLNEENQERFNFVFKFNDNKQMARWKKGILESIEHTLPRMSTFGSFDTGIMESTKDGFMKLRKSQRNLPGTKKENLFKWRMKPMDEMCEGTFASQELIQCSIRLNPKDSTKICKVPKYQDQSVYMLELLRQFMSEFNYLVVVLDPVCNQETCPKMIATAKCEFLCAAHKKPKECCAIDYITHTLNGFTALLNSNEIFPSRVRVTPNSMKFLASITRRVYRIFAHAFFHHREVFDQFEKEIYLCSRFVKYVLMYNLMQSSTFMIPLDQLPIKIDD